MRLAFMGTPDFAVYTLSALIEAGHEIAAVYTQPPARSGRGKKMRKSPVHDLAEQHNLPVFTPASMRDAEAIADFAALSLDMAVVVAYGQILPVSVLEAPTFGCVNVHASLLPRWRGAAPIHRAVMAGDTETGVDIMVMEAGLDTGPVLAEAKTPISDQDTTASLHDRLAQMGAYLIDPTIRDFASGKLTPRVQASQGITYARKIEKAESKLDFNLSAKEVSQHIRGLYPFPGAWFSLNGERIKLLSATIIDKNGQEGVFLDDHLTIACGKQALQIETAQRAGKAAMQRDDFLRGMAVPAGSKVDGPDATV